MSMEFGCVGGRWVGGWVDEEIGDYKEYTYK